MPDNQTLPASSARSAGIIAGSSRGDVLMVGAGVVNLLTAYYLTRVGYRLRVLDARPDPRQAKHWSAYGCSRAGDDARMFTLTEADSYHAKVAAERLTVNGVFRRPLSARGWNVKAAPFTSEEDAWISDFERVPCWLARLYNEDIFSFNRESQPLWNALLQDCPELFHDVGYSPGILRLYTDTDQFEHSALRHEGVGALRRILEPRELTQRHPGLATCSPGVIVGGLEVVGFTVNVHGFMVRMISWLERSGASFTWEAPVEKIKQTAHGEVEGLGVGPALASAHSYVLSPGAYGQQLLAGTRSAGKVHGVLGVWMRLPNLAPELRHSLKVARRGHMAEDANVTLGTDELGRPVLIVGSGYGYVGEDPSSADPQELEKLFEAVEDTCRRFFPQAYAMAADDGSLRRTYRVCVRPWTASNLGVFETMPTTKGGTAVITGGHNTGGFAQAPSVAQAVLAALDGRPHPMQELYDPDRLSLFLRPIADGQVVRGQPGLQPVSATSQTS